MGLILPGCWSEPRPWSISPEMLLAPPDSGGDDIQVTGNTPRALRHRCALLQMGAALAAFLHFRTGGLGLPRPQRSCDGLLGLLPLHESGGERGRQCSSRLTVLATTPVKCCSLTDLAQILPRHSGEAAAHDGSARLLCGWCAGYRTGPPWPKIRKRLSEPGTRRERRRHRRTLAHYFGSNWRWQVRP